VVRVVRVFEATATPPIAAPTSIEPLSPETTPAASATGMPSEAAPADARAESAPPPPPPDSCVDTLAWVAEAGLPLPPGVGYHCPSSQFPHQGAACWDNGSFCPGRGFIAINMDRLGGASDGYLRHVVAHEVCHILEFQATGRSSEPSADACAAAHGAPT